MCIAIVKPAGAVIADDVLKTCFENNPDGAGFAYRTAHGLVVEKGMFTWDAFIEAYRRCGVAEVDALIHFRITTRGDDSPDNTHPFATAHGALIHNGTIFGLGERKGQGKSDTRVLSEHWHSATYEDMERLFPVFESYVDGTRVAFMDHSGRVHVFNRKDWIEKDGVLYSNAGFEMDVYGYNAYRGGLGEKAYTSGGTKKDDKSIFADDVPSEDDAYDRAEWYLGYEDEGSWMWIDNRFFFVDGGVVVEGEAIADDVLRQFQLDYGHSPVIDDREDEALLDDLTNEYLNTGFVRTTARDVAQFPALAKAS